MTTKFQVSDRTGEAIFLVSTEHDDPGQAFGDFAHALSLVGNQAAEATLARLEGALLRTEAAAPAPLAPAVATVTRTFPQAAPVAPQVPAAAAGPAADGAPAPCQHGAWVYREAKPGAAKHWRAWFCAARSTDPTRCEPNFIR